MQIAKITEAVTKSPFQPFEVITSSGDRFTVRHPEMVRVVAPDKPSFPLHFKHFCCG